MISVVIPTHNRYNHLLKAVESVKNQTYKNIIILEITYMKMCIFFFKASGYPIVYRCGGIICKDSKPTCGTRCLRKLPLICMQRRLAVKVLEHFFASFFGHGLFCKHWTYSKSPFIPSSSSSWWCGTLLCFSAATTVAHGMYYKMIVR